MQASLPAPAWIRIAAASALAAALLTAAPAPGAEARSPEADMQETPDAIDFELEGRDGEMVRLSDYRGKKVLAIFWASW